MEATVQAEPATDTTDTVRDDDLVEEDLVEEELLVEEISIDGMCGVYSTAVPVTLDQPLELDPRVALRREPFGTLAYHYGNRRLVFLRHPDMVAVVERLGQEPSVQAALEACGVAPKRWPGFVTALGSLEESEVVRVHAVIG